MIGQSLWQTAVELQARMQATGRPFCFIGGLVVQRWGEPRVTADVDATILCDFGQESQVAKSFVSEYQSRIDDPVAFAIQARILLLRDKRGNNIDLSIGGLEFEHRLVSRSSLWGIPDSDQIRTCSAEDLVILKAFASREQDWIDVKNILIRQSGSLNHQLIRQELTPLVELKEEPTILSRLEHLLAQY